GCRKSGMRIVCAHAVSARHSTVASTHPDAPGPCLDFMPGLLRNSSIFCRTGFSSWFYLCSSAFICGSQGLSFLESQTNDCASLTLDPSPGQRRALLPSPPPPLLRGERSFEALRAEFGRIGKRSPSPPGSRVWRRDKRNAWWWAV